MLMFIAGDKDQPSIFNVVGILNFVQAMSDVADLADARKFCNDFAISTPWGYLPLILERTSPNAI
jgi:hypothetical protein